MLNPDCAKTIRFEVLSYWEVYISDLHYSLYSLYYRSVAAGRACARGNTHPNYDENAAVKPAPKLSVRRGF